MEEYHLASYWNQRYQERPQLFDFYAQIPVFCPYFESFLSPGAQILILGAGTSREPYQLYDMGFHNIRVVDFSRAALEAVQEHLRVRPEIDYTIADVTNFHADKNYDFLLDKGLLDCVLADPDDPDQKLQFVLKNIREKMGLRAVWCSITFDGERDDLIEEAAPNCFRIERNEVCIDVFGVEAS